MTGSPLHRSSVFALIVVALCVVAVQIQPGGLTTDFPSFYAASGSLAHGDNPYNIHVVTSYARDRGISAVVYPYLYPPFLASVMRPMTWLAPGSADRMWGALMVVMLALSAVMVTMVPRTDQGGRGDSPWRGPLLEYGLAVGILLVLPLAQNILMGQVNALVLACLTIAILGTEREGKMWQRGAGAALAVAALIKVTPALLVLLLVARKKTTAVWSFLAASAAGVGISVLISGPEVWGQFLRFLPQTFYGRGIDGMFHPILVANLSLSAFVMRAAEGAGPAVRLISMLGVLLLLSILLWALVRSPSATGRQGLLLALLVVMVVVSPYTWIHHMIFLYPGVFLMFRDILARARYGRAGRVLVLSALFLVGLTIDFPELYPLVEIPEAIRGFVTSMNLFFLLGLFAVALRWASLRAAGAEPRAEPLRSRAGAWSHVLPFAWRGN